MAVYRTYKSAWEYSWQITKLATHNSQIVGLAFHRHETHSSHFRITPSFLKDFVENTYLYHSVLNKILTTHEKCIKHNFLAPWKSRCQIRNLFVTSIDTPASHLRHCTNGASTSDSSFTIQHIMDIVTASSMQRCNRNDLSTSVLRCRTNVASAL